MFSNNQHYTNQEQVSNQIEANNINENDILNIMRSTLYPKSSVTDEQWYCAIQNTIGINFEEIYRKPYGRFDGFNFLIVWLKSLSLNDHEKSELLKYLLNSGFSKATDSEQEEIPKNIFIDTAIITLKGKYIILSSKEILIKYLNIANFEELNAHNDMQTDDTINCTGVE